MVTSAGYDAVLIAHILIAVVGFGALGASGAYGALAARAVAPFENVSLRRYFATGPNLVAWTIVLVPVLGAILLAMQHPSDVSEPYPWVGLALWVVAIGLALAVIWPAERSLQGLFANGDRSPAEIEQLRRLSRRASRAAMVTSVCFVAAFAMMVIQPS